jgi:hypothetical protein
VAIAAAFVDWRAFNTRISIYSEECVLHTISGRCRGGWPGSMMPNQISSGSPGALLRRGPLRTGRARFRATGSSKPCRLSGSFEVWACCRWYSSAAVGVYEAVCDAFIRRAGAPDDDRAFPDRLAGGGEPSFPLARALRFTVGVQQQPWTGRAAAMLQSQEPQRGRAQRGVAGGEAAGPSSRSATSRPETPSSRPFCVG